MFKTAISRLSEKLTILRTFEFLRVPTINLCNKMHFELFRSSLICLVKFLTIQMTSSLSIEAKISYAAFLNSFFSTIENLICGV